MLAFARIKNLEALHVIVTSQRGKEYWEAYNSHKQICLRKIHEKIREENTLINSASNKTRKIWEIIKGENKARTKEHSNLNAEGFNTYFATVPETTIKNMKKMEQHPLDLLKKQKVNSTHSMFLNPASEEEKGKSSCH